jgi:dihydrofolate reductase
MAKVVVAAFSLSLDGFGAGADQRLEDPLGKHGLELHRWFMDTPTFRKMHDGNLAGTTAGVDEDFAARSMTNVGAWIMGRNMFGPVRGPWPDASWRGWWGDEPPYHVPTFVLTHHPRASIEMKGGTTFHFVTDGIRAALDRAREVAGDKDIRIGGGVATIQQYVRERLVDELHFALSPTFLGRGERMFDDLNWRDLGYRTARTVPGENATHVIIDRVNAGS